MRLGRTPRRATPFSGRIPYPASPLCCASDTRGLPLLVNELIWSLGATMMMQLYSMRGLQVLAGLNIAGTVSNMFNTSFIALGNTVAVIIGQILGAGEVDKARRSAWQLTALTAAVCVVMGGIMALFAGFFPTLYNTEDAGAPWRPGLS